MQGMFCLSVRKRFRSEEPLLSGLLQMCTHVCSTIIIIFVIEYVSGQALIE